MTLNDLQQKTTQLRAEAGEKLAVALAEEKGADWHAQYLGKKGQFNELAKSIKDVVGEQKRAAGELLNELKTNLEELWVSETGLKQQKDSLWAIAQKQDSELTLPASNQPVLGHLHPITQAIEDINDIFTQIGFRAVRHNEVDSDFFAFEALNMPANHPARDEWETFFLERMDGAAIKRGVNHEASPVYAPTAENQNVTVLTPHTSNGQVREMLRLASKPPIRMVNISRCYRRQQDATHTQMFHQFEGLVVDKGISIAHLRGVLDYFAESFYGPGTKSRIRPFHFQFTEPSFEVDFSCHLCGGTGKVKDPVTGEITKCRFCKSGWHEVGGAGMTHPNVLAAGGIDPDIYTGFAFGWGVERTYSLREGLNIDDIRHFYTNNLEFLEQF